MSDVTCPKCKALVEICTDDGYGFGEFTEHNQECPECEYEFIFHTTITVTHEAYCQTDDHKWEPSRKTPAIGKCQHCDSYRKLEVSDE